MSILSTRPVADTVARLFAATINPTPKPGVRFPHIDGHTTTISIPTRHGDVEATLYRPTSMTGDRPAVYVNVHGGGFVIGHREQDDPWCRLHPAGDRRESGPGRHLRSVVHHDRLGERVLRRLLGGGGGTSPLPRSRRGDGWILRPSSYFGGLRGWVPVVGPLLLRQRSRPRRRDHGRGDRDGRGQADKDAVRST
jgi:hypothetical protein